MDHIENNFTFLLECLGAELAISIEEKKELKRMR